MVVFGDSASDVGSYRTPAMAVAYGGGKFTINDVAGGTDKVWVEILAEDLGLTRPCAAQTGLESSGPFAALAAPVTDVPGCYAYAQGGSRVTNPVGTYNKALLALGNNDGLIGQLTKPFTDQVARYLAASGGSFAADDLVIVAPAGNDLFINLAAVNAAVQAAAAAPGATPESIAAATTAAGTAAVQAMALAGAELSLLVSREMLAKGAKRVMVGTYPDFSNTPFGLSQSAQTRGLMTLMSTTFNEFLITVKNAEGGERVLFLDGFGEWGRWAAAPADYGLTNVTSPACATLPGFTAPYSLFCSVATLAVADASTYAFADSVHPTPKGHRLLADLARSTMEKAGWLPD
jgi:phospholipase/lecithinase/hemolysin